MTCIIRAISLPGSTLSGDNVKVCKFQLPYITESSITVCILVFKVCLIGDSEVIFPLLSEIWLKVTLDKGPFVLDDNDVNFSSHQKWVALVPIVLFTLDDKEKIMHYHCCQWNLFLSWLLVRTVPKNWKDNTLKVFTITPHRSFRKYLSM